MKVIPKDYEQVREFRFHE